MNVHSIKKLPRKGEVVGGLGGGSDDDFTDRLVCQEFLRSDEIRVLEEGMVHVPRRPSHGLCG